MYACAGLDARRVELSLSEKAGLLDILRLVIPPIALLCNFRVSPRRLNSSAVLIACHMSSCHASTPHGGIKTGPQAHVTVHSHGNIVLFYFQ